MEAQTINAGAMARRSPDGRLNPFRSEGRKRLYHVERLASGDVIVDGRTGDVIGDAGVDPLAALVAAAERDGLPHMRLLWNRADAVTAGVVAAMTAGDDAAIPWEERRQNPVVQRETARQRAAGRVLRGRAAVAYARRAGAAARAYPLFAEVVRLAAHSQRLRGVVTVIARDPERATRSPAFVEATWQLVKDVKLQRGEPITPLVPWPVGRDPATHEEALRFLQRPELFGTENLQRMRWHANRNGCVPELLEFVDRVIHAGDERGVPLFAEVLFLTPAEHSGRWVRGEADGAASADPHCHGRGVLFGHAAETRWPAAAWRWLIAQAEAVAEGMDIAIGYSLSKPAQFIVADADGVLLDPDAAFPGPDDAGAERDRLLRFYRGEDD